MEASVWLPVHVAMVHQLGKIMSQKQKTSLIVIGQNVAKQWGYEDNMH